MDSSKFTGFSSFVVKEKFKSLKNNIKLWKENCLEVGNKDVQEAKTEMVKWDIIAEQKCLSEEESISFKAPRANYFKAEKQWSLSLKQKARVKWAVEGDENCHFFHDTIKGRLNRNNIKGIMVNGTWIEDPLLIKMEIFNFFSQQFREPTRISPSFKSARFKHLDESQVLFLQDSFLEEEVKRAVWNCARDKAPEPDGFTFAFLKAHWDLIKYDILALLKQFDQTGRLVKGENATFLTLIPKVTDPISIADYKPIVFGGVPL